MKKILTTTLAIVLLLGLSVAAQPGNGGNCPMGSGDKATFGGGQFGGGHKGGGRHGGMGGGGFLKMADKLELTDAQVDQLKDMQTEFKLEQVDAKADLKKAQIRMKSLMRDDNASESTVMAAMDELAGLKAEMHKKQYLHRKEMKGVLTAEQQEKAKELRKEFRTRRAGCFSDDDNDDDFSRKHMRRGGGHGRI